MRSDAENPYQSNDVASPNYEKVEKTGLEVWTRAEKIVATYFAVFSCIFHYPGITSLEKIENVLAIEPYHPIVDTTPTASITAPTIIEIPKPKLFDYFFEVTFSDPRSRNGEEQRIKIPIHSDVPLSLEEIGTIIRQKIDERINPPMA